MRPTEQVTPPSPYRTTAPATDSPTLVVLSKVGDYTRTGDRFVARCPLHATPGFALTVRTARDHRALLECEGRCKTPDIVARLGLEMSDLFPAPKKSLGS